MARKKTGRSPAASRSELSELRAEVRAQQVTIDRCCRDLEIQLRRIGQLQMELDDVRRAWVKTPRRR